MDGRWKLAVAGGVLLAGLAGCKSTSKHAPVADAPPTTVAKNVTYVPEPADDGADKDGPLSSTTMLTFANVWVDDIAKNPNKPPAERERLLSQARGVYQDVLSREPKNVDALLSLGEMYAVTGEADKLREVEQRAAATHPQNPKVWAWLAVRQSQAKQFDAAIESYTRAVKLDPDNRMYRIHLGFTCGRAGRYAEAADWLNKSMKEPEARYNLAMVMAHNGETDKARLELQLALKADPSFQAAADKLTAMQNTPQGDLQTVGHQQ